MGVIWMVGAPRDKKRDNEWGGGDMQERGTVMMRGVNNVVPRSGHRDPEKLAAGLRKAKANSSFLLIRQQRSQNAEFVVKRTSVLQKRFFLGYFNGLKA